MKILFTGGSSFTGYWFIKELAAAGHEVFAAFTKASADQYEDLRARRVNKILDLCRPTWSCAFGDEAFLKLIAQEKDWDLLCHHAAFVKGYKSADFDVLAALETNTRNLKSVLAQLADAGCGKVLLTGSVFEQNEGEGERPLRAFSPYGLSKGLTAEIFRFWCQRLDVKLARFVIPNPFGPFEEKRFTAYLIDSWLNDKTPAVNTPDYVRDNIHVSLLAKAYRHFAEEIAAGTTKAQLNPSGYIESQGAFARRLSTEMKLRLNKPCALTLAQQIAFDEPLTRANFDQPDIAALGFDETAAWDQMAEFYLQNRPK
ncbi:MAG TPA: NAD(P)-dependent oxidoreductase [Parvularculaceae bacterium]|nr:NAD(P)-dependent oxidoreductase [Parvularculaceae bacterium]